MEIPAYALTDAELWTPTLVLPAIVNAIRVFRHLPMSTGPASPRSCLPEFADEEGQSEPEERYRPRHDEVEHAFKVMTGFTDQHGRQHPAWMNGAVLGYPDQRRILVRWSKWASYGKVTFDGIGQTEDEFAREQLHMSKSTMIRQRDVAAKIIAKTLNDAELEVWRVDLPKRTNRHASSSMAA